MKIERLQFITSDNPTRPPLQQIKLAIEGGVRWIQLRLKNKPFEVYLETALEARKICNDYQATLIINDNLKITQLSKADGIHLGLGDTPIAEARKILGPDVIIGGTANTLKDIHHQISQGANYLGVGPFRFTNTKKNLSPLLGLSGYQKIMESSPSIPLLAIGGLRLDDLPALMALGLHGVAISSAISHGDQPQEVAKQFIAKISSLTNNIAKDAHSFPPLPFSQKDNSCNL